MTKNEEWYDMPGYEGYYKISTHGRVKSLWNGKEKIRIPTVDDNGDVVVVLYKPHKLADILNIVNEKKEKKQKDDEFYKDLFGNSLGANNELGMP